MDIASVPVPTEIGHADGTHGIAETGTDAMSIAVFAVTTEQSAWLFSTALGLEHICDLVRVRKIRGVKQASCRLSDSSTGLSWCHIHRCGPTKRQVRRCSTTKHHVFSCVPTKRQVGTKSGSCTAWPSEVFPTLAGVATLYSDGIPLSFVKIDRLLLVSSAQAPGFCFLGPHPAVLSPSCLNDCWTSLSKC